MKKKTNIDVRHHISLKSFEVSLVSFIVPIGEYKRRYFENYGDYSN